MSSTGPHTESHFENHSKSQSEITSPRHLINYEKYPIDEMENVVREKIIDAVKESLAQDGCALLKGFLCSHGLSTILGEVMDRRSSAFFSDQNLTNAYFSPPDSTLPDSHPVNFQMERTNGFITSDHFGPESACRQLYLWEPLGRFLSDCLGKPKLHIYADPISNMIVNVCTPGTQFNWHFDTNEFTITMLLKPARKGGYFEYAPDIRTANDESYQDVSDVLNGSRERVKRLDLQPGDLQFFLGRYSLHQVTKNSGDDDRLLIIMSFTEEPGVIGSKQRVQQLYGKTTALHDQQKIRSDGLRD